MPAYDYEAVSDAGAILEGRLAAADPRELETELAERGLTLIRFAGAKQRGTARRVSGKVPVRDLADLAHYLGITTAAGLPVLQSLEDFREQTTSPRLRSVLESIVEDVAEGEPLGDSFARHPRVFDESFLSTIRAGEASGSLDEAMLRAAKQIAFRARVLAQVRQALIQPLVLLTLVTALIVLTLTFLLPRITGILEQAGAELPVPTMVLLTASDVLVNRWPLIVAGLVAALVGARSALSTRGGRAAAGRFAHALPVIGPLLRISAQARFVSALRTLYFSGVDVVRALRLSADSTGSGALSSSLYVVADRVQEGASLSEAMAPVPDMHPLVTRMVQLGESTGNLERTLESAEEYFSDEIPRRTRRVIAVIEPSLIAISGLVVTFIVLSVLLPIFRLYETI